MPTDEASLARARRILTQRLESLARAGVMQMGKLPPPVEGMKPGISNQSLVGQAGSLPHAPPPPTLRKEPEMPRAKAAPVGPAIGSLLRQPYPPLLNGKESRTAALELINSGEVKGCKLCRELAAYRTQTVFGVGNVTPRVVMFGEALERTKISKGSRSSVGRGNC